MLERFLIVEVLLHDSFYKYYDCENSFSEVVILTICTNCSTCVITCKTEIWVWESIASLCITCYIFCNSLQAWL